MITRLWVVLATLVCMAGGRKHGKNVVFTPNNAPDLQAAIDGLGPGMTVELRGVWFDHPLTIHKSITMIGLPTRGWSHTGLINMNRGDTSILTIDAGPDDELTFVNLDFEDYS